MFNNNILNSKSWPAIEAKKILQKAKKNNQNKIILETGYGPSGLPHIGTFGEVTRTSMVKFALENITDIPIKLIAFSDDLDGLRKVPDNVPNKEILKQNLQKPLTKVPDPFGKFNSFGEHNNNMLCEFLDKFGFDYEFYSSTKCYNSGMFDEWLLKILKLHTEITEIVKPTLGEERRETYSPFLPIDKKTGKVLQAKIVSTNPSKGTIVYINENNEEVETEVTGGKVKLQWKVDWAMRWCALDVDYEMYGKDLIHSFELSSKICKKLKKTPPINFMYEHFLDDKGQKISKSKGNGISIEDWLTYANPESLSTFMFQKPQTAKRLYFDVIPKYVDEWLRYLVSYNSETDMQKKVDNPAFYIYKSNAPKLTDYVSFNLILNLVSVSQCENAEQIWHFIDKYKVLEGENRKAVGELLKYAIHYNNNFVKPFLKYKVLSEQEKMLFQELLINLENSNNDITQEELQKYVYNIGVNHNLDLKDWFKILYMALLGKEEGPRMGSFFKLLGLEKSKQLINNALNRI